MLSVCVSCFSFFSSYLFSSFPFFFFSIFFLVEILAVVSITNSVKGERSGGNKKSSSSSKVVFRSEIVSVELKDNNVEQRPQ